ncbi:MAG: proline racemase family protein [Thermoanaerobaculia bacterium]|nr:proline racemase family protein [Thermoanaerobaculia bacterium]
MNSVRVVDSHTEGEPTRVVIDGAPDLGPSPSAADRLEVFKQHHDSFRSAVVNEPRGFDAMVGALLLPPADDEALGQMLFFNNVGCLRMCGHGTLGVVATLQHLGRIAPGRHRLESPEGDVEVLLHEDGTVSLDNVFSYRHRAAVEVETERHGSIAGDVAWGGNWFFLVDERYLPDGIELELSHLTALTDFCWDVRRSFERAGLVGADGGAIDHVEVNGAPKSGGDGRNFVLCPGGEYDRSPCGTGTSAKLACLAADGKLQEGMTWCQESVIGSAFDGAIVQAERDGIHGVLPTIRGRAFITAESTLHYDPADPFIHGIRV